jgi:hypothetical protein
MDPSPGPYNEVKVRAGQHSEIDIHTLSGSVETDPTT